MAIQGPFGDNNHRYNFTETKEKLDTSRRSRSRTFTSLQTAKPLIPLFKQQTGAKTRSRLQRTQSSPIINPLQYFILQACKDLETRVVDFPSGFDENKISQIKPKDVKENFRSLLKREDRSEILFYFNETPLHLPAKCPLTYMEIMTWLVEQFELKSDLTPFEQAALICGEKAMNESEKEILKEILVNYLENKTIFRKKLKELEKSKEFDSDFKQWLNTYLTTFFTGKDPQTLETFAEQIVSRFVSEKFDRDEEHLKAVKEKVPCYSILQAICISTCITIISYLRKNYPLFFDGDLRMKAPKGTRYQIKTDQKGFHATQMKYYHFYKFIDGSERKFGSIELHWTVNGDQGDDRTAQLRFHNLRFEERATMEERAEILNGFGYQLDKKELPSN